MQRLVYENVFSTLTMVFIVKNDNEAWRTVQENPIFIIAQISPLDASCTAHQTASNSQDLKCVKHLCALFNFRPKVCFLIRHDALLHDIAVALQCSGLLTDLGTFSPTDFFYLAANTCYLHDICIVHRLVNNTITMNNKYHGTARPAWINNL